MMCRQCKLRNVVHNKLSIGYYKDNIDFETDKTQLNNYCKLLRKNKHYNFIRIVKRPYILQISNKNL